MIDTVNFSFPCARAGHSAAATEADTTAVRLSGPNTSGAATDADGDASDGHGDAALAVVVCTQLVLIVRGVSSWLGPIKRANLTIVAKHKCVACAADAFGSCSIFHRSAVLQHTAAAVRGGQRQSTKDNSQPHLSTDHGVRSLPRNGQGKPYCPFRLYMYTCGRHACWIWTLGVQWWCNAAKCDVDAALPWGAYGTCGPDEIIDGSIVAAVWR